MIECALGRPAVRRVASLLLATGLIVGYASAAAAVDCQKDFAQLMGVRQQIIGRINGFNQKKPTPAAACSALTQLVNSDKKTLEWLETNKSWCQIPDEVPEGLKKQSTQSSAIRGKACAAAQAQAKQLQQQQRAASSGPSGLPGSGVRLPGGAL